MQVIHDLLDNELFIEVLLTESECLTILGGSLICRPVKISGKKYNISVICAEDEDATH